jgi:hypothetical protein
MSTSVKISQLVETPVIGPNDSIPIARGNLETFRTPARQFVSEGLNIGVGPGRLFALKSTVTPTTLQFRTLSAVGENLAIETVGNTVVFSTSGQNPIKTTFVADGSATTWPLIGFNSNNAANYRVDFDGVLQEPFTDYNLSANHIVFTTAPLLSTKIVIVSSNIAPVNEAIIPPNSIETEMLKNEIITTNKIIDNSITELKLANSAVTNSKLQLSADAGEIKKALNADNDPPIYACRAWVNFDGTAGSTIEIDGEFRCTIRASGNVSKVVRNSTGNYTITFTTAMPDANYAISHIVGGMSNGFVSCELVAGTQELSGFRIRTRSWNSGSGSNASIGDASFVSFSIFR